MLIKAKSTQLIMRIGATDRNFRPIRLIRKYVTAFAHIMDII